MIMGAGVLGLHKDKTGQDMVRPERLYELWVDLLTLPISGDTAPTNLEQDKSERKFWIVDDSRTKIWQSDTQTVYVPFDVAAADAANGSSTQYTDADTGKTMTQPARTRDLQVAVKPGVSLQAAKQIVQLIVESVQSKRKKDELAAGMSIEESDEESYPVEVQTWEESQETFITAIEHEKVLVTVLFSLISVVAIFLIFCIFYMIVVEKTQATSALSKASAPPVRAWPQSSWDTALRSALCGGFMGLLLRLSDRAQHQLSAQRKWASCWAFRSGTPRCMRSIRFPTRWIPKEVTIIVAIAVISSVLGATAAGDSGGAE